MALNWELMSPSTDLMPPRPMAPYTRSCIVARSNSLSPAERPTFEPSGATPVCARREKLKAEGVGPARLDSEALVWPPYSDGRATGVGIEAKSEKVWRPMSIEPARSNLS